jgi:predicted enzyme related to lactoylglutathione lyase
MQVVKTYFMLTVQDMDRAAAFYREVFGLTTRFVSQDWSELAWGDAIVALHGGRSDRDPLTTGLGFEVDDVGEACRLAAAAGGAVVVAPEERAGESIRLAEVADPEGNVISVAQTV